MGHLGRRDQVVNSQLRRGLELFEIKRGAGELSPRRGKLPQGVGLFHLLHHFKKPGPAGDAVGFEGRGHRKADGFLRPAGVGHHQVGGHGVQPPFRAFLGCFARDG